MTTPNSQAQEVNDVTRDHEVRVQAVVKTLTAQRDAANNATVNAMSEKAVVESRLAASQEQNAILIQDNAKLRQQLSEMRIVCANLQGQVETLTLPESEPGTDNSADIEEPQAADIDVKSERTEKQPGMLARAVAAVMPSSNS